MTGDDHTCPRCGEYMHADEEWRLLPGRAVGGGAQRGDYVHARCHPAAEGEP